MAESIKESVYYTKAKKSSVEKQCLPDNYAEDVTDATIGLRPFIQLRSVLSRYMV